MVGAKHRKKVDIPESERVMLEMSSYYSTSYLDVRRLDVRTLSYMYSGMLSNKAITRLHRIEELSCQYMKEKDREKFVNTLYKQIDSSYNDKRAVSEDELKRILGNVGHKSSNTV